MPDLTDAQLVILSAAAQRVDGSLLPIPKTFNKNEATIARVLKSLIRRGMAAERPTKGTGEAMWREDKDGKRYALVLTEVGRRAIGGEEKIPAPLTKKFVEPRRKPGQRTTSAAAAKQGTKLALLTDLLRRKGGATIDEAVKATGWQPHSVRGAISGGLKKRLQLAVVSSEVEGRGRVYRIACRG